MAIIREPDDVDLVFDPTPPTKEELKMISEFIRKSKEKNGIITWDEVMVRTGIRLPSKPLKANLKGKKKAAI